MVFLQVKKLKASIQKLKAENEGYRQDNKAAEFEAQLQASISEASDIMTLTCMLPTCPSDSRLEVHERLMQAVGEICSEICRELLYGHLEPF